MSTTHRHPAGSPQPAEKGRTELPPNHVDPEVLEREQTRWTPLRIALWAASRCSGVWRG